MRITIARLLLLILTAFLVAIILALPACVATSELPLPTPADKVIEAAGLPSVGKLVVRGNLTLQVAGLGSTQTNSQADNRKSGQRQGSAATGAGATSGNASRRTGGGVPWWVWGLVAVASAGGWQLLRAKILPLKWLG